MSTEQSPQDPSRSTIVSRSPGLAYERVRAARPSHFSQSIARKLTVQGCLLAALAAALSVALVGGGGRTGLAYLAAAGGALVAAGATAHAGVGVYRLCWEPLTEREALALVTVEDAGSYLGIATGGTLVAATLVAAALGFGPGNAPADAATTTAVVATGAATLAAVSLSVGRYLSGRLPRDA